MSKQSKAARLSVIRPFVSAAQFQALMGSRELQEAGVIDRLAKTIESMPATGEQDGKGEEAVAHLHYFNAGSDWFILEKDKDGGVAQAFGYAILNGDDQCAELGYISITELAENGVELDFFFEPCTLGLIKQTRALAAEAEQSTDQDEPAADRPTEVEQQAEPMADPESVDVPVKKLRAALLCSAEKDVRFYLNTVYLHSHEGVARIVSTDGSRMLVQSAALPNLPAWMESGILLEAAGLREALSVLGKHGELVTIKHGADSPAAIVKSADGFASFRVAVVDGKFPDYQKVMDSNSASIANDRSEALRAANLNHKYVKGAVDCAKVLGATGVQAFAGDATKAATILFPGADEAVMIIMPMRDEGTPTGNVTARTAALISGGVKASIAALKSHITRQKQGLKTAKDTKQREEIEKRIAELQQRIDALSGLTTTALPAPAEA